MFFGWMSIDVRVEVSICGSLKVSVDGYELLSINVAHLSLWIMRSNHAGFENSSDFSLLLTVLLGMHLKEIKKKFMRKICNNKT